MELPVCQGLRPTLWASSSQILDASSTCSRHQGCAMHQHAPRVHQAESLFVTPHHAGQKLWPRYSWPACAARWLGGIRSTSSWSSACPCRAANFSLGMLKCMLLRSVFEGQAQHALRNTAWKSWAALHISACRRSCRRPVPGGSFQCHPVQRTSLGVPAPSRKSIPSAYWALMGSASKENKCSLVF